MTMPTLSMNERLSSILQERSRGPIDGVVAGTIRDIDAETRDGNLRYQLRVATPVRTETFDLGQADFKRLLGDLRKDREFLGQTVGVQYDCGKAKLLSPDAPLFLATVRGSGGYDG